MRKYTLFWRGAAVVLCLFCLYSLGRAATAIAAEEGQSIVGVVQGIVNYGDAYGYVLQDADGRTVSVAIGNGDEAAFENVNIGSVLRLKYTAVKYPATDVWPHETVFNFYEPGSGALLQKGPPMPWDEAN